MKKLSPKVKKVAIFAGLALVCIGCLSLVMIHANAGEESDSSSNDTSTEIVLGTPHTISVPPISSEATGTGSAFVPSSGTTVSEPLTTVSKPTSTPPNPTPPASSALTNKSKKPTYSSKLTVPKNTTSKSAARYNDPVFGNKTSPTGGKGTTVGNPGDQLTGDKVGTMD